MTGRHWVRAATSDCWAFFNDGHAGNAFEWSGDCTDRMVSGYGTLKWRFQLQEHATLTGNFTNGRLQGPGTITFADGERFEGTFDRGTLYGDGKQVLANGSVVEGHFLDGQLDGEGHIQSEERDIRGRFLRGQPSGPCTMTYSNGIVLKGEFRDWFTATHAQITFPDGRAMTGDVSLPRSDPRFPLSLVYPEISQRLREQGTALISAHVDTQGNLSNIRLLRSSGSERLDQAALAFVSTSRMQPAKVSGQPIEFDIVRAVRFALR